MRTDLDLRDGRALEVPVHKGRVLSPQSPVRGTPKSLPVFSSEPRPVSCRLTTEGHATINELAEQVPAFATGWALNLHLEGTSVERAERRASVQTSGPRKRLIAPIQPRVHETYGAEHRARLVEGLFPLGGRHRVGNDATARLNMQRAVLDDGRADCDRGVHVAAP